MFEYIPIESQIEQFQDEYYAAISRCHVAGESTIFIEFMLSQIDRILEDHTVGEAKTGDLAGVFGYDIYYNKTNYELAYTVEYVNDKIVVVIMAGTRENFYDELKRYMS